MGSGYCGGLFCGEYAGVGAPPIEHEAQIHELFIVAADDRAFLVAADDRSFVVAPDDRDLIA